MKSIIIFLLIIPMGLAYGEYEFEPVPPTLDTIITISDSPINLKWITLYDEHLELGYNVTTNDVQEIKNQKTKSFDLIEFLNPFMFVLAVVSLLLVFYVRITFKYKKSVYTEKSATELRQQNMKKVGSK